MHWDVFFRDDMTPLLDEVTEESLFFFVTTYGEEKSFTLLELQHSSFQGPLVGCAI